MMSEAKEVDQTGVSWNRVVVRLRQLESMRRVS
jgi:hypothetical protein